MSDQRPDLQGGTGIESELSAIWCEVLRLEKIGRDEGFALCGGDSLAALRVLFQVYERFAVEISLAEFLQHDTIATLSDLVLSKQSGEEPVSAARAASGDEGFI